MISLSDTTTLLASHPSVTMKYDGKGRRIQKAIANSGQWDCTYKYFYDNDSCIEERNGSDYVIKGECKGDIHLFRTFRRRWMSPFCCHAG